MGKKNTKRSRFEDNFQTRLKKQQEARNTERSKRLVWVQPPAVLSEPEDDSKIQVLRTWVGWDRKFVTEKEISMLVLKGWQVKDHDPYKQRMLQMEQYNKWKTQIHYGFFQSAYMQQPRPSDQTVSFKVLKDRNKRKAWVDIEA